MTDIVIRPASEAEFSTAVEWAAGEGWNPGLDDLSAFFAADPDGFLMGFVEDEPVSSISVVRYGADFGFLGFYIVRPDYRGSGAGMAIWNAGMRHLDGRTVGLDGVVAQQDNYRKSGFILSVVLESQIRDSRRILAPFNNFCDDPYRTNDQFLVKINFKIFFNK